MTQTNSYSRTYTAKSRPACCENVQSFGSPMHEWSERFPAHATAMPVTPLTHTHLTTRPLARNKGSGRGPAHRVIRRT